MEGQRNPDIQRLLANLRNGAFQNQIGQAAIEVQSQHRGPQTPDSQDATVSTIPGLGMVSPEERQGPPIQMPKSVTSPVASKPPRVESEGNRSTTPVVPDASSITAWPAALKHITKHTISDELTVSKIRHLISEQHKHEQQWWAGREAIMARHSGRADNQAKVADLLKSLGGLSVPVAPRDPAADQAELDAYDKKVYKGLTDMAADFDRQLRRLQIPFFAIKHELVILEDGARRDGSLKGRIDKGELRELQKRMIETLEDLVGDD